jgi:D-alanine-D-alanine ligase
VEEDGGIVFNEINTLPGFTSISMYPKLMMHEGMRYSTLLDRLIASALGNTPV